MSTVGKLFPRTGVCLFVTQQHCGSCDGRGQPSVTAARHARAHTHNHEKGARGRARPGLLLLWCNGGCAVGGGRGVEWVLSTVGEKRPTTVSLGHPSAPPRDCQQALRHRQDPVLPHGQVRPLAPQLALSWRLERFLTHLYDVAARRERQRHPVRPP